MKFHNEVLWMALATASEFTSAFVPSRCSRTLRMDGRQGGQERNPSDLIPELKLTSAFEQTKTLRWEMRSTLTSNEEVAASQTEDSSSPPQDIPEFPEMASTGIYEIMSPEHHK